MMEIPDELKETFDKLGWDVTVDHVGTCTITGRDNKIFYYPKKKKAVLNGFYRKSWAFETHKDFINFVHSMKWMRNYERRKK